MVNIPNGLYNSQQRYAMYRWHIMDPVRFEKSLKIAVQDLGWREEGIYLERQDDIATTVYWYQALPTNRFPLLPDKNYLEVI